ncbi:MAG: hypothetical protein ACR2M1_03650 [Gemmatimonadaceae bacterium]
MEGQHAADVVRRRDNHPSHTRLSGGGFQEPVEVRGENDARDAVTHQLRDRAMRRARHLAAFGSLLLGRLKVGAQEFATPGLGRGQPREEVGVSGFVTIGG